MNVPAKKKFRKKPLGATAYDLIFQKIITLEYEPGQSLEVNQVMSDLGLGRTPIREALMRLMGENKVEQLPGKGFMVPPITLQNTKATFEMMKILEVGAARLAVQQDPTSHIPELKRASESVNKAIEEMDILHLVTANHDFHIIFAQCSHNEYMVRWIDEIRSAAKRLSYLSYSEKIDSSKSLKAHYDSVTREHEEIISYLEEKNENELEKTILEHIEAFQKRIIVFMSS